MILGFLKNVKFGERRSPYSVKFGESQYERPEDTKIFRINILRVSELFTECLKLFSRYTY
jgi:hypothetical protein